MKWSVIKRYFRYGIWTKAQAIYKSSELSLVHNNLTAITPKDIIAIIVFRNEKFRLPYFLQYYRSMGVNHFICIDNESTDGADEYLAQFSDCTVFRAKGSYKASQFGLHWVNYILNKYCTNHWILHVDPDEFLVYPYMDTRDLRALVDYLGGMGKHSFQTLLLDCYGKQPIKETVYIEGMDPLEICPWFDGYGYTHKPQWHLGRFIQGGVRRRVFFKDTPEESPALNKTPLVRWAKNYRFLSSTHVLYPRFLNRAKDAENIYATGCLLHFKFFSVFTEKIQEELVRQEHWGNSLEYRQYARETPCAQPALWHPGSLRYEGWQQLLERKFMGIGNWF